MASKAWEMDWTWKKHKKQSIFSEAALLVALLIHRGLGALLLYFSLRNAVGALKKSHLLDLFQEGGPAV